MFPSAGPPPERIVVYPASRSACICAFSSGPVLMCRCASMNPGIAVMPLASIVWPAGASCGRAGRHGHDFSRAHHDRSALDHRAVGDDDAGVGDRQVLRRHGRQRRQRQAGKHRQRGSVHFTLTGSVNRPSTDVGCLGVRKPPWSVTPESPAPLLISALRRPRVGAPPSSTSRLISAGSLPEP